MFHFWLGHVPLMVVEARKFCRLTVTATANATTVHLCGLQQPGLLHDAYKADTLEYVSKFQVLKRQTNFDAWYLTSPVPYPASPGDAHDDHSILSLPVVDMRRFLPCFGEICENWMNLESFVLLSVCVCVCVCCAPEWPIGRRDAGWRTYTLARKDTSSCH